MLSVRTHGCAAALEQYGLAKQAGLSFKDILTGGGPDVQADPKLRIAHLMIVLGPTLVSLPKLLFGKKEERPEAIGTTLASMVSGPVASALIRSGNPGLASIAGPVNMSLINTGAAIGRRFNKKEASFGSAARSVGNFFKTLAIGDPKAYWDALRTGTLHKPGSPVHSIITGGPPGTHPLQRGVNLVSTYLPTALAIPSVAALPDTQRPEATGEFVGSLAGNMLGAPLGMLGGMTGSAIGRSIGGAIGRPFNTKVEPQHLQDSGEWSYV